MSAAGKEETPAAARPFRHGKPSIFKGAAGTENLILLTDSYKVSHHVQYPTGTTRVYSYFESRGGKHAEVCFFGLQYLIKRYLVGQVITEAKIQEAKGLYAAHFGPGSNVFNEDGWRYILEKHGGRLPVKIRAVPEGTVLPYKNCCMTVENTDPECYWLVNFLETLLVQVWYPMTVATNSREQKKALLHYLRVTGDPAAVDFKLHDFGFRGVSSIQTAGIGGAAHLTQFLGTDTIAGIVVARDFYGAPCAGFSIPASEHSTITSWGRDPEEGKNPGGEIAAMKNMLEQYPKGLVACVSDSYSIWDACSNKWGKELKDTILQREGTLVVRPDSGPPPLIDLGVLERLGAAFGAPENDKGYKELPPQIRMIQGDGISFESLIVILAVLESQRWSINNIAFGSGGGLLQKLNRDTQKCAFKCAFATINGVDIDVYKQPIHAPGKKSKRGRMTVNRRDGVITTLTGDDRSEADDIMVTVFENGDLTQEYSWDEVKQAARVDMDKYDEWCGAVVARAETLLDNYKASQYAKDVEAMKVAEADYSGPF